MSAGVCREDVPEDSAACDSLRTPRRREGDLGLDRKSVKVEGGGGGGWGDELL